MENQKILNLLNDANDSKFVTKNGTFSMIIQIHYAAANEITYNTEILRLSLCNYNDTYILVTGNIIVVAAPAT